MKTPLSFSQILKHERDQKGWSQDILAGKLGVEPRTVRRWEKGESTPHGVTRQKLCDLFGKTPEELGLTGADQPTTPQIDWVDAPRSAVFYGREMERERIKRWLTDPACRLVALLGIGGVGKTTLAARVVEEIQQQEETQDQFKYVFWRSLQNAPPLTLILQQCLQFLAQEVHQLPDDEDGLLRLLLEQLHAHRCLLILDNVESLLQPEQHVGRYRDGYTGYEQLFTSIATKKHNSCLLLTSREKPKEIASTNGPNVHILPLGGLNATPATQLLRDKALSGTQAEQEQVITLYSGNPLALNMVSESIHTLYGSNIAQFLHSNEIAFGDITDLLHQQMLRLSPLEREILYWLAIEREATSRSAIEDNLAHIPIGGIFATALESLNRRFFVESHTSGLFSLQPVIMEYVTNEIIRLACEDFLTLRDLASDSVWSRFAFVKAQSKHYIYEAQKRLLLTPIAEQLSAQCGRERIIRRFNALLTLERQSYQQPRRYVAGNILNLLLHLGYNPRDCDFSHITIRQAHLQHTFLQDVNFTGSYFQDALFTNTFGSILTIAFYAQQDLLAAGTTNGTIWLYQAGTGQLQRIFTGHTDSVWSIAFHPSGTLLASGSDDLSIRLWRTADGAPLHVLTGHSNRVRSVAFNLSGSLLASGSEDHTVRVWDVSTGTQLHILEGHKERVWSIAFSPTNDELLASGSTDGTVRLWNYRTGECLHELAEHTGWIRAIAFSPSGEQLVSASDDHTLRVWDTKTGCVLQILQGHTNRAWSVSFSPDDLTLASGDEDGIVRLWETSTWSGRRILQGHTNGIRTVCFTTGTQLASGGDDQTIRFWDAATGDLLKIFQGYANRVWSISISPDGRTLASCSEDRYIRLWDIATGQCSKTIQDLTHKVRYVGFHPRNGSLASSGEDQTVRLWDTARGRCLQRLEGHRIWVRTFAFSSDGTRLISGDEEGTIYLWHLTPAGRATRAPLQFERTSWVRALVFSPDDQHFASGGDDRMVRLWDATTDRCLLTLRGHTGRIRALAYSTDGKTIISGSEDRSIRCWDTTNGTCTSILSEHSGWVLALALSPDGEILASASDDLTIRLWDLSTGTCTVVLSGHTGRIRALTFTPDGEILASAGDDGQIILWDVKAQHYLRSFMHERPYERMEITEVSGLTEAQKANLRSLGAVDADEGQRFL